MQKRPLDTILFTGNLKSTVSIEQDEKSTLPFENTLNDILCNTRAFMDFETNTFNNKNREIQDSFTLDNNMLYRPKKVRYEGKEREGQCPICSKYYKLKTSCYWYHMNYKNGINKNGIVIPSVYKTRTSGSFLEAYCEKCAAWVQINTKNKNKEFGWRKHWQKYHTVSKDKRWK